MANLSINSSGKGCSKSISNPEECGVKWLPHSFFERDTIVVARDLIGREIWRKSGSKLMRARIVETEAYLEKNDPASHSSRGQTPRAKVMFGDPGTIYVYFIYGMYFMLNFVTEKKGRAGAVLIRAVEPLEGIEKKTNGPAKLVLALNIDDRLNGKLLGWPRLAVAEGKRTPKYDEKDIVVTTRIGINVGKELPLRFYERGNKYVSVLEKKL